MELQHATSRRAPARPRRVDVVAVAYGVGWFSIVGLTALGLWLVEFQVAAWIQQVGAWSAAAGFVAWTILGTPSSRLAPERRAAREQRRMAGLLGASIAVLLLGGFVAWFQLRSWSEWVVLGGLLTGTVGVGFTLHAHLLFRRR